MPDSDSDVGELRSDGSTARALTMVIGEGGGYIPLYKEPPRYIRVKAHNKKERDFNHLFLAQELNGGKQEKIHGRAPATAVGNKIMRGGDAIWAAEFSLDGKYLAVAGKDHMIRVFQVISTPEERREHDAEEAQQGPSDDKLRAPVFRTKPFREWQGHGSEVLALSWSKNSFLLSTSLDKTVRLWHPSRAECLSTFIHEDLVTSIAFHPTDDRFFLAGSLDTQLRLWSIPDKSVAFQVSVDEFITAVAFSPDGKVAICGVLSGMCTFFDTEGLKPKYKIHVRSSRGKNAKGSKITGIRTMRIPTDSGSGQVKVLVSSNDSRVRVYNLNDKLLQVKYKGLENQSSQINARFSDDGKYIISGSEDRKAYIWEVSSQDNEIKDKQPYESFDAHPEVATTALMAPTKTRQLLSASGDPLYDLCNPPPVLLRSLNESRASQTALSDSSLGDVSVTVRRPEENPAYLERCKHLDGHIVVTTDRTGTIKVFRQDCAYTKRQQGLWESGSKFSGRINGVNRSASIMTRTSAGSRAHSRRGSLSTGPAPVLMPPADRINSWRQDIDGGRASVSGTPTRSERSISPIKSAKSPVNTSAANLASEARKLPYVSTSPPSRDPTSPTSSIVSDRTTVRKSVGPELATSPPTPSFSLISADDKNEGSFWSLGRWRSGLRSPPPAGTGGNGNLSPGGHTRATSEFLTPDRTSARRSMGIGDFNRLRSEERANRRKSAGPLFSRTPPPEARPSNGNSNGSNGKSLLSDRQHLSPTKRVDSGLGRMSADSRNPV